MMIFSQAPIWVWPLLAGLVAIGARAMRERRVPVWLVYGMPFLGLLAVRTVAELEPGLPGWAVFAAVWLGSAMIGHRLAKRWVLGREGTRVHLRGEGLTFAALMLIFWANFAAGVLEAMAPAALQGAIGIGVFAGVLAAASGQFAGRALRVARA